MKMILSRSSINRCCYTYMARSMSTSFHLPDFRQSPKNKALTKIVATIGPTSEQMPTLGHVFEGGMNIMRLNFSHATKEEVELRTTNLAQCTSMTSTLLDTRGPEIRSGKLQNDDSGHETIHLEQGKSIVLETTDARRDEGSTVDALYIDYPKLAQVLDVGSHVLLDDGAVVLTVTEINGDKVVCHIDNTGDLRSRAGVNLPGTETDLPAMSDKDKADILYGMTKDIDFVAASFVQNAQNVLDIRAYLQECQQQLNQTDRPLPLIISKIESLSALQHFDEILDVSDGIMVARGDLGVEIPITQIANAQKEMVAACRRAGKPVVVATQMLESMSKNPSPTRAEVTDVTNAVYDGADAVMLSGETAKGKFPVKAVQTMNAICQSAEHYYSEQEEEIVSIPDSFDPEEETIRTIMARAAVEAVDSGGLAALVVVSPDSMELAQYSSAFRPTLAPIVACVPSAEMARQLMIYRGIHPVVVEGDADVSQIVKDTLGLETGDSVVVLQEELGKDESATISCMMLE